jgi:glycosyltransferase involved in cell wall biosynthesis
MAEPLITVVTAVRDGIAYLPETIASVRAQSVTDWEYVIVDDASTDGTAELVAAEMLNDDRISLIRRTESGGPYVAANEGLQRARGRYIARIDADDVAPPERFAVQLGFLGDHPELRACGGFHRTIDESGGISDRIGRIAVLPGVLRWRLSCAGGPIHSTAFVERAAFEAIGGYVPLRLAQDWRMWSELSLRGWLGVVPEVVAFRRQHTGQVTERSRPLQTKLALDIARDHLYRASGELWDLEAVRLLWRTVRRDAPLRGGLRVLARWGALWRKDPTLSIDEREQLGRFTSRVRRHHVYRWLDERPASARVVRAASAVREVLRSSHH